MPNNGFIQIPLALLYNSELCKPNIREFYGLLVCLSHDKGYCFASNAYLAENLHIDVHSVTRWIKKLKEMHFVKVELIKGEHGNITQRKIFPLVRVHSEMSGGTLPNAERVHSETSGGTLPNEWENIEQLKEKYKIYPPTPFEGDLGLAVGKWLNYKIERRQGYKATGKQQLFDKIETERQQRGDKAVIEIIEQSISNNYNGLVWDKPANSGRIADDFLKNIILQGD